MYTVSVCTTCFSFYSAGFDYLRWVIQQQVHGSIGFFIMRVSSKREGGRRSSPLPPTAPPSPQQLNPPPPPPPPPKKKTDPTSPPRYAIIMKSTLPSPWPYGHVIRAKIKFLDETLSSILHSSESIPVTPFQYSIPALQSSTECRYPACRH